MNTFLNTIAKLFERHKYLDYFKNDKPQYKLAAMLLQSATMVGLMFLAIHWMKH